MLRLLHQPRLAKRALAIEYAPGSYILQQGNLVGYRLKVGNSLFDYGYSGVFGGLNPDTLGGETIEQIVANDSSGAIRLQLSAKLPEDNVRLIYAQGTVDLAWSGSAYTATDAGLANFIASKLNEIITLRLEPF